MLDTRRLESFIAIVDLGSLSRAAEQLGVSQPTLSNLVAALEADLQTKLLIRSSLGVRPTGAGSLFYRHAQLLCRQISQASADIRDADPALSGIVCVGLPISTASVLSLPLFTECRTRFPGIRLRIQAMPSPLVLENVLSGRLDSCLVMTGSDRRGLCLTPLYTERFFLFRGAGSGGTAPVPLAELATMPILLPSAPNSLRAIVDTAFAAQGLQPNVIADIDCFPSIQAAVRRDLGGTISTWAAMQTDGQLRDMVMTPIEPTLERTVSLCWPEARLATPATAEIQALIIELVDRFVRDGQWVGCVSAVPTVG